MPRRNDEPDVYVIPPNFIEGGTLFGGSIKARNVIEAAVLALAVGYPIFQTELTLTWKIIAACLTSLPLGLFGLIGVSGESLSSFIMHFFRFIVNRRIIGAVPKLRFTGS